MLDDRALNRALLARQHLLARTRTPVPAVVEHLVGLQAQNPWSPFLGLWSRVEGFTTADLDAPLLDRTVSATQRREVLAEARRCVAFLADDADTHDVRWDG